MGGIVKAKEDGTSIWEFLLSLAGHCRFGALSRPKTASEIKDNRCDIPIGPFGRIEPIGINLKIVMAKFELFAFALTRPGIPPCFLALPVMAIMTPEEKREMHCFVCMFYIFPPAYASLFHPPRYERRSSDPDAHPN